MNLIPNKEKFRADFVADNIISLDNLWISRVMGPCGQDKDRDPVINAVRK